MTMLDKTEELFDYTDGYEQDTNIMLRENLPDWMVDEAITFYNLFNKLWGLCVISGMPGNGKDLFGNYASWLLYMSFPHKRLLRDEKPRELFGKYDGLFNPQILKAKLDAIQAKAKLIKDIEERVKFLDKAADDWVNNEGQGMLQSSLLYLTEYWKYCNKRYPHAPMNKIMAAIHKQKRHFDTLIFGTIQLKSDLDQFTCLPFIDWEIKARRSRVNPTGFLYFVFRCEYLENFGHQTAKAPLHTIKLDGAEMIDEIGKPIEILQPEFKGDRQEKRVLDAINEGAVWLKDLSSVIKFRDTTVKEVVKKLYLERAINYGNWFNIYNSKSPARF